MLAWLADLAQGGMFSRFMSNFPSIIGPTPLRMPNNSGRPIQFAHTHLWRYS
jgi:hypothetical protein